MKRIYNFIMCKPILIILAIISIVFLPSVISAEPQGFSRLIVRCIGIDKVGEEYELSALSYVPQSATTFSENFQIFSTKGDSLFKAVSNLSKLVGKDVELSHSNLILVNNELCEYGIIAPLDYLIREYSLGNNSLIFSTGDVSAKEVLEFSKSIAKKKGIKLQDLGNYVNDNIFAPSYCLERIFAETLSPNKITILAKLTLEEDEGIENEMDQSSSNGGESGETEGSSGSSNSSDSSLQTDKKLINTGDNIIFKEGKKIFELTYEEMFDYSWGKDRNFFGTFELRDYSDNIFTNSDITFFIFKSTVKLKTKFENGTPICDISINPELMLNEVNQESINQQFYPKTLHLDSSQIIKNINKKIGMDFSKVFKKTLGYNIDLLDVYDIFYSNNNKDFKAYLATLEDEDDYISRIEFRINVEAKIIE